MPCSALNRPYYGLREVEFYTYFEILYDQISKQDLSRSEVKLPYTREIPFA